MEPLELGAVTLYPFGAAVAAALAAGAVWSLRNAAGPRQRKTLEIFWLAALPLGLFLAHLGWCLSNLDMIEDEFLEVLCNFPEGGYLIYGALAGAAAALGIACRITGERYAYTADWLAGPLLLLGAVCALGEGLIGGGYGWKVEDWFLAENGMSLFATEEPGALTEFFSRFPFALRDAFYGYANWAVFLPVGLGLLVGIWGLSRLKDTATAGNEAIFSLSLYAAVRIFYESLRQDDIPKWGFVRVNQVLSAVLLLVLVILCARSSGEQAWPSGVLLRTGAEMVAAMEFALEDKILEGLTMDVCYVITAAGCCMMYLSVSRLRKLRLNPKRLAGIRRMTA